MSHSSIQPCTEVSSGCLGVSASPFSPRSSPPAPVYGATYGAPVYGTYATAASVPYGGASLSSLAGRKVGLLFSLVLFFVSRPSPLLMRCLDLVKVPERSENMMVLTFSSFFSFSLFAEQSSLGARVCVAFARALTCRFLWRVADDFSSGVGELFAFRFIAK